MTFDEAAVILKAVLGSTVGGYPVSYENEGAEPPSPATPWIEAGFRLVIGEQRSIGAPGDNLHDDEGALIVYIFTPLKEGDATSRQLCETVSALFRGKYLSGVEILDIGGDDGGGVTEDGGWWRRWRRIEFRYQMTG